jgi:hypothetical protein
MHILMIAGVFLDHHSVCTHGHVASWPDLTLYVCAHDLYSICDLAIAENKDVGVWLLARSLAVGRAFLTRPQVPRSGRTAIHLSHPVLFHEN